MMDNDNNCKSLCIITISTFSTFPKKSLLFLMSLV